MSNQDTTLLEPVGDASRSRTLAILLGVVVVLALAAGAYWLFLAPASDDVDPAVAAGDPAEPVDPAADDVAQDDLATEDDAAAADAGVTALPTVTYEVFLSRDPFEPVVPEEVTPASETGDTTDQTQSGDDSDADDPDSQTTPPTEGCSGQDEVVCNGHVVSLVDVTTEAGEPVAVIQVDSTIYEVTRGEQFAGSFEVRAIDPPCVSLLFGDDGFQLCEGDRVLK